MTGKINGSNAVPLIHVHICAMCGRVSRREEKDGTPDSAGLFHCSSCGHVGNLNEDFIEIHDDRLKPNP